MGATFAYFSVSNQGTQTTNITATTPDVGVVSLTKSSPELKLNLTAQQMSQAAVAEGDVTYYATPSGVEDKEGSTSYEFASFKADKGTVNYTCTANVSITVTGGSSLKTGDAFIDLTAEGFGENLKTEQIDFSTIATNAYTKNGVEFELSGTTAKKITGKVRLVNKQEDKQDYLGGLNLGVAVKVDLISCTVKTGE